MENKFISPESRYILPSFTERTSYGYREQNPYNKLFEDRIIFLGVQVDDASADDIMAQLLVLESQDPDRVRFQSLRRQVHQGHRSLQDAPSAVPEGC